MSDQSNQESGQITPEAVFAEATVAAEILSSLAPLPQASRLHVLHLVQVQLNRLEQAEGQGR